MVKGIESIKQELQAIEETVQQAAAQLQQLYFKYLESFEQSLKRQLILACYHICTHVYPQAFLQLSFSQKQQLQQQLQQIIKQFQPQLIEQFSLIDSIRLEQTPLIETKAGSLDQNLAVVETIAESQTSSLSSNPIDLASQIGQYHNQAVSQLSNPNELLMWQTQLEAAIKKTLEILSTQANTTLGLFEIISSSIPPQILEIAVTSEESGSPNSSNVPNILYLVVETNETKDKEQPPTRSPKITIVRLRLGDLEYADPSLSATRQPIQNLVQKISKIKQQYQQKQQKLAQAEAEAAWRACWYQD